MIASPPSVLYILNRVVMEEEQRQALPCQRLPRPTTRESLYSTWEFYGNTTIRLCNEPSLGQLNPLCTSGIVYAQPSVVFVRAGYGGRAERRTRLLLHKLNLHTCIMHLFSFHCLHLQMCTCVFYSFMTWVCVSSCALACSVPIFEGCARHVCFVALNNSLGGGIAALLWRNILPLVLCSSIYMKNMAALIAALLNITARHTGKKTRSVRPNERRQTTALSAPS